MKWSNKGITLLELVFATSILVFALTGILALFISTIFLNQGNRNATIASMHGEYMMEKIKNENYATIASTYNNKVWNSAAIQAEGLAPLDNETITSQVAGIPKLLDITVTTAWRDSKARNRSVSLETLIAQP